MTALSVSEFCNELPTNSRIGQWHTYIDQLDGIDQSFNWFANYYFAYLDFLIG